MSRPATSRLKVKPPLGSPPTLEWRAVAELLIDESYQRSIETGPSRTLIRKIAMYWDWGLCQPLAVSRRPDGKLTIVDGQHRASAAKLRGDIAHLPCVITSYANSGDEAAAFVALNQMRRPLSALDLFKAAVAAEDNEALTILKAVEGAGLRIAPHMTSAGWKAGMIGNIGGLLRCYRRSGEPALQIALAAMGKAWPGEVIAELARIAGSRTQAEWRKATMAAAAENAVAPREGAEMAFRLAWRSRHNAIPILPEAPKPTSMKPTDHAWCPQCDRRVTGIEAERCTSPFCKVKAVAA